jgi:hypothetical protein
MGNLLKSNHFLIPTPEIISEDDENDNMSVYIGTDDETTINNQMDKELGFHNFIEQPTINTQEAIEKAIKHEMLKTKYEYTIGCSHEAINTMIKDVIKHMFEHDLYNIFHQEFCSSFERENVLPLQTIQHWDDEKDNHFNNCRKRMIDDYTHLITSTIRTELNNIIEEKVREVVFDELQRSYDYMIDEDRLYTENKNYFSRSVLTEIPSFGNIFEKMKGNLIKRKDREIKNHYNTMIKSYVNNFPMFYKMLKWYNDDTESNELNQTNKKPVSRKFTCEECDFKTSHINELSIKEACTDNCCKKLVCCDTYDWTCGESKAVDTNIYTHDYEDIDDYGSSRIDDINYTEHRQPVRRCVWWGLSWEEHYQRYS